MDPDLLLQIAAVGGVGGLVVEYFRRSTERRIARSKALEALAAVEELRWADRQSDAAEYRKATHTLEAAALVANVPQRAVTLYLVFADAARWLSDLDRDPDSQLKFDLALNTLVIKKASVVRFAIWRPTLAKLLVRRSVDVGTFDEVNAMQDSSRGAVIACADRRPIARIDVRKLRLT